MLAVVRLPSELVDEATGGNAKSDSTGVMDIEAPELMRIGNSPWWQKVNIVGGKDDCS